MHGITFVVGEIKLTKGTLVPKQFDEMERIIWNWGYVEASQIRWRWEFAPYQGGDYRYIYLNPLRAGIIKDQKR
jgi:hypothetical protein